MMILVYDKFVQDYISKEYIGKNPGLFAVLFKTESYQKYQERVSNVSKELSQFSDAGVLISYLVEKYGLSLKKAKEFVNKNVSHRWKRADSVEKRCMLIHTERKFNKAMGELEETIESLEKE